MFSGPFHLASRLDCKEVTRQEHIFPNSTCKGMMEEEPADSYWMWKLTDEKKVMSKMIDDLSYKLSSSFHVCTELYERSIQS